MTSNNTGFRGFWLGLSDAKRGWLIIGILVLIVAGVIGIFNAIGSSDYRDCVNFSTHEYEINFGTDPKGTDLASLRRACDYMVGT